MGTKETRSERIKYWENAFMTIKFQEQGIYGNPINLGQTTIALSNLRQGIRSLPLCDRSNTQKGVASILVNVKYTIHNKSVEAEKLQNWKMKRQQQFEKFKLIKTK